VSEFCKIFKHVSLFGNFAKLVELHTKNTANEHLQDDWKKGINDSNEVF